MISAKEYKEKLQEALEETFESMAFAMISPRRGLQKEDCRESWLGSRLNVDNQLIKGGELLMPLSLAKHLSATMFADMVDEESMVALEVQLAKDSVAELLNTITGALLLSLEDKLGEFSLGIPREIEVNGSELMEIKGDFFAVDEEFTFIFQTLYK